MPKILFITSCENDYLQDSLLLGFKSLYGNQVIEFPEKPQLYNDYGAKEKLYGKGFTIYCTLPTEFKPTVKDPLANLKEYDIFVFSSIHRQYKTFNSLKKMIDLSKTIVFDGEDEPYYFTSTYVFRKNFWPSVGAFLSLRKLKYYFKRELTSVTAKGFLYKLSPFIIRLVNNIRPIAFSIPEEKIVKTIPNKTKLFPCHIVDAEVAAQISSAQTKYAFDNEESYYGDLQASKFGITTKRAGWDCMRHYEIAANGAVICFRDLDKKELHCAPHGLNETNCITYNNYKHLMHQINNLSEEAYIKLQTNALLWVRNNTTKKRAEEIIKITDLLNG